MNRWLFVIAIGAAFGAADAAQARPCANQMRQMSCDHRAHFAQLHHPRHAWHPHERPVILAAPPPAAYVPYEEFYPPMPASLFDLPPDRDFLNTLR